MAEVIVGEHALAAGNGVFNKVFGFFGQYGKFLLIMIVFGIIIMIIIILIQKLTDERKEKDDPGYALFNSTKRTCSLRKKENWIKLKWSFMNIFFLGLPIKKIEQSVKVVDINHRLIGWYRGDFKSQDQCWNFLLYRNKSFGIIENQFVLKIPLLLRFEKVKDSSKHKSNDKLTKSDYDNFEIDMGRFVNVMNNGNIKIDCIDMERIGLYYFCPVYPESPLTKQPGVIDYRQMMEGAIIDNTYQLMTQRIINVSSEMMERMAYVNPNIQAAQKVPEKTKSEESNVR